VPLAVALTTAVNPTVVGARRRDMNALPHLLATGQPGLLMLSAAALLVGVVLAIAAVRLRPRRRLVR